MKTISIIVMLMFFSTSSLAANTGYQGLLLSPEKILTPYNLVDKDGTDTQFPTANGKYQLVFFGYTSCPDVCPTTLHKVTQIIKAIKNSKDVDYVFVSIDTERDNAERIKAFLGYFHPDIKGLSGSIHNIKKVEKQFGILTRKFQGKSALAYQLEHSVFMYLINKQGKLMLMYPGSATPSQIVEDLKLLTNTKKLAAQE